MTDRAGATRNVFVLSTGRSGTHTFVAACSHMTNRTAGHESRISLIGDARLAYPPDHVEADNRLTWLLGRLEDRYGGDARYVHLTRDEAATAQSFVARYRKGIMLAYRTGIINKPAEDIPPIDMATDYVRTVERNIAAFLKDKPLVMEVRLAHAKEDFRAFWEWVGAEGDLDAALAEWDVKHDATRPKAPKPPKAPKAPRPRRPLHQRILRRGMRALGGGSTGPKRPA